MSPAEILLPDFRYALPKYKKMEEKILKKLETLEKLSLIAAKTALTLEEAAFFTGLSKSILYKKTHLKEIPHYKGLKFVYFNKDELTLWMLQNRVKTNNEIEAEAATYVVTGKKKGATA